MKTSTSRQDGFGAVELIFIVLIIAIIGAAGWYVWGSRHAPTNDNPVSRNTATNTNVETIEFNKSKLPEKWVPVVQVPGELIIDSSYYGSSVDIKKVTDNTAKASSAESFTAEHRTKTGEAAQSSYDYIVLPDADLTVATNKGSLKLTSYIFEIRNSNNHILSTHAETFIVKDGYYIIIDEVVNGGQHLANANETLNSVKFNL